MSKTNPNDPVIEVFGVTKREYFAALAMQGLLANRYSNGERHEIANIAVNQADALIAELNKEPAKKEWPDGGTGFV